MRNRIGTTVVAGVSLLVALTVGTGVAQVVDSAQYMNTGLFFLNPGAEATLYVSIDDNPGGPPARVLLQAFDERGVSVALREVTVGAGQSASLRILGPGHFRGHIRIIESPTVPLSERRAAMGSAEINDGGLLRHVCFSRTSHDWEPLK